ncbi:hypothetical protein [Streptomyces synnematoformans]|uniref:Uncharacterized protein n=1 Tax=Streptomyces synnematoformans TaxID=415721 RepID=A0ABN2XDP4_9ACTN
MATSVARAFGAAVGGAGAAAAGEDGRDPDGSLHTGPPAPAAVSPPLRAAAGAPVRRGVRDDVGSGSVSATSSLTGTGCALVGAGDRGLTSGEVPVTDTHPVVPSTATAQATTSQQCTTRPGTHTLTAGRGRHSRR